MISKRRISPTIQFYSFLALILCLYLLFLYPISRIIYPLQTKSLSNTVSYVPLYFLCVPVCEQLRNLWERTNHQCSFIGSVDPPLRHCNISHKTKTLPTLVNILQLFVFLPIFSLKRNSKNCALSIYEYFSFDFGYATNIVYNSSSLESEFTTWALSDEIW